MRKSAKDPVRIGETLQKPVLVLAIIILCAFSLRVLLLGHKSLWLDEAFGLYVSKAGPQALWSGQPEIHHPPLFHLLQAHWVRLGESEFTIRLLSVLFGALCVVLLYELGKKTAGEKAGLSAAAFAALSPLLVWYSQEARSYSLLVCLGLAVMMAAMDLFLKPSLGRTILFSASMTAAAYTHYGAFLLVPLQAVLLLFLFGQKKARKKAFVFWAAGWIFVFIAYLPWLKSPAARAFLGPLRKGSYPVQLAAGKLGVEPGLLMVIILGILAPVLVLGLWLCARLFQKHGRLWEVLGSRPRIRRLLLVAFIAVLIASVIPRGYSIRKQLTVLFPYLLLFFGCLWPWEARHKKALALVLPLSFLASLVNIVFIPKDQWRQAADYIHARSQENDVVVLLPDYATYPFDYYDRGRTRRIGLQPSSFVPEIESLLKEHGRLWLVSNRGDIADPGRKIETWLEANARPVESGSFHLIQTRLFQAE